MAMSALGSVRARAKIEEYKSVCLYFKKHHLDGTVAHPILKLAWLLTALLRLTGYAVLAIGRQPNAKQHATSYWQILLWHIRPVGLSVNMMMISATLKEYVNFDCQLFDGSRVQSERNINQQGRSDVQPYLDLLHPALRRDLIERGLRCAISSTREQTARKTLEVFESVAGA